MVKMKLAEWAKKHGLSYLTANRHFHAGMIPNAHQLDSGTILVDDDTPEQTMTGNTSNDAMSLFLKKTVEFSKNGSTVEDFAAFVISNFSLKLPNQVEAPKYSRQKPKSEDVQRHFQKFIPKGEKPKPNSFIMDPKHFEEIAASGEAADKPTADPQLVEQFSQAVSPVEGAITRSVDLNTTPQPINYTGSINPAFNGSLSFSPTSTASGFGVSNLVSPGFPNAVLNNTFSEGIVSANQAMPSDSRLGLYYVGAADDANLVGAFQPTQKELQSNLPTDTEPQARRRGRKPSKRQQ